jgi:hypothetical protein
VATTAAIEVATAAAIGVAIAAAIELDVPKPESAETRRGSVLIAREPIPE